LTTRDEVRRRDPAAYEIFTDEKYHLPELLPNGIYNPDHEDKSDESESEAWWLTEFKSSSSHSLV